MEADKNNVIKLRVRKEVVEFATKDKVLLTCLCGNQDDFEEALAGGDSLAYVCPKCDRSILIQYFAEEKTDELGDGVDGSGAVGGDEHPVNDNNKG